MKKLQYLGIFAAITAVAVLGTAAQYAASRNITVQTIWRDLGTPSASGKAEEITKAETLKADFELQKSVKDGKRIYIQMAVKAEKSDKYLPVPVWLDYKMDSILELNPELTGQERSQWEQDENKQQTIDQYAESKGKKVLPVRIQLRDQKDYDNGYKLSNDGTLYWTFTAENDTLEKADYIVCDTTIQPTGDSGEAKTAVPGSVKAELKEGKGQLIKKYTPTKGGKVEGADMLVRSAVCRKLPDGIELAIDFRYDGALKDEKKINSYLYNHFFFREDQWQDLVDDDNWQPVGMEKMDKKYNTSVTVRYYDLDMEDELYFRICDWSDERHQALGHVTLKAAL